MLKTGSKSRLGILLLSLPLPSAMAWEQSTVDIFNGDWGFELDEKSASCAAYFTNENGKVRDLVASISPTKDNVYRLFFTDRLSAEDSCEPQQDFKLSQARFNGMKVNLFSYCGQDRNSQYNIVFTPQNILDEAKLHDIFTGEGSSVKIEYDDLVAKISTRGFTDAWNQLSNASSSAKSWKYDNNKNYTLVASNSYESLAAVHINSGYTRFSFDLFNVDCEPNKNKEKNVQPGENIRINGQFVKTYEQCVTYDDKAFKTIWAQTEQGNQHLINTFKKANVVEFSGYNKRMLFSANQFTSQFNKVQIPI